MTATALAEQTFEGFDAAISSRGTPSRLLVINHEVQQRVATTDALDEQAMPFRIKGIRPNQSLGLFPRSFACLQQWEGQVKEVTKESFVAVVSDKTNQVNADEEVELDLADVDVEDMRLVRPGALFYWAIGYEDGIGVPRQRVSRIRFRRLPGITTRDIARAKDNAKKFASLFE